MDNINLKIKINIDNEIRTIKKKIESLKLKPLKIDLELNDNNIKNLKSKNYEKLNKDANKYIQSEKEVIKVQNESKASALSLSSAGNALISSFTSSATDMIASFAIDMIIKGFGSLIVTLDEQKQKVREAQEAYSNTKSEIENINSELEITNNKLNELQSKGNLSLVEKDELTNLQQINYELERKKELLEAEERFNAKDVNEAVKKEFDKDFRTTDVNVANSRVKISELNKYKKDIEQYEKLDKLGENRTSSQEKEYKELNEYIVKTSNRFQGLADKIIVIDDESKAFKKSLSDLSDIGFKTIFPDSWNTNQIDKLLSSDFSNIKDELLGLSNAGKLDESTLSKYSDFKNSLDDLGISADEALSSINKITNTQFRVDPDQAIKESISEIQTFTDKMKPLQEVYQALNNAEKISTDTLSQLIMKYPEYSSELLKVNDNREDGISLIKRLFEIEKQEAIQNLETIKSKIAAEKELFGVKSRVEYNISPNFFNLNVNPFEYEYGKQTKKDNIFTTLKHEIDDKNSKDLKEAETAVRNIEELQASLTDINLTDNTQSGINKGNYTAEDKAYTPKDKFEKEYNSLKEQRSNDIINAQQYYDKLKKLNDSYFANKPEYADEYQQYELELHRLSQDLAEEKIKDWEFDLQLKINAVGEEETVNEQITVYTKIQDELHRLAEEERNRKVGKNEELIQQYSEQWWEYEQKKFNITKQYYDKQKSMYEGYISTIEKVQDMTISMIKKEMEMNKEIHAEKIKSINDEFDLKRSILDDELDEYTYNKELQSKIDNVNKIQSQIDLIKNDESNKGKLKQLEDELKNATTELDDFQYNHDIDLQKQILDEQEKSLIDEQQTKIDAIDEKLNDEVYLKQQADEKIKTSGQNLYNELITFAKDYGTISKHEIDEIWLKYSEITDKFDIKQNGVTATLGTLYNQLLDVKTVLEEIDNMSLGDFSSSKYSKPRTKEDVIADMKANSEAWHKPGSDKTFLENENNTTLANELKDLGFEIEKKDDGYWYYVSTGKRVYHNGGIVGNNSIDNLSLNSKLKPNELHSILEEGELVISKNGVKNLLENIIPIKNISTLGLPNYNSTPLSNLLSSINHTSSSGDIVIENNYNITGTTSEDLLNNMKQMVDKNSDYTIKKIAELAKNNSGNKINTIYKY